MMASNNGLYNYQNVDLKIKCMHCKATKCAHTWTCTCGLPWFACKVHARKHMPKHKSPFSMRNRKRKAPCGKFMDLSHDQLMQQDAKKHKKARTMREKSNTIIVDDRTNGTVVNRISFGPKITDLLAKFRNNGAMQASFKLPSSASSST